MGNDSARPFYFAVQQLSVLGNVIKNNRPDTIAPGAILSLAKNVEFLSHFPKLNGFKAKYPEYYTKEIK